MYKHTKLTYYISTLSHSVAFFSICIGGCTHSSACFQQELNFEATQIFHAMHKLFKLFSAEWL